MNENALVVFSDHTDIWWLKGLKKGFRHCFIIVHQNGLWVSVDPLAHCTEILVIDVPDSFCLASWLRDDDCIVVKTTVQIPPKNCPLWPSFSSCVEGVKRILGLRQPLILTPWQLYRHLTHERK